MKKSFKKISSCLSMPQAAVWIGTAALGALGFALIMEYGFHLQPCVLCMWQRAPFAVAVVLAFAAILWKPYSSHTRIFLSLCALSFAVGAGLAIFHTGVERHWWLGTAGCSIQPLHGTSPQDLRAMLLDTPVAHCDQISWTFLGLSMANWNVPFSLILMIYAGLAQLRVKR